MAVRMRADIYLPIDSGAGASQRGSYDYDVRESRSSRQTRSYYEYEQPAPRREPRVRYVDSDQGEAEPRVIVLRDREPEPITIVRERAGGQRVRYVERGGDEGYFEDDRMPARRRQREEYDDEGGDEPIRRKPAQRKSLRAELIEQGVGVWEHEGRYYEVYETRSGRLDVAEVGEPAPERDIMPVRRSERSRAADDGDRRSSSSEPSKSSGGGGIGRTLARVAGWGLVGLGGVLAVGAVGGVLTHGATWPVYGRLWPTMSQAIWPLGFGVASMATGGVILKATKKPK